MAFGAFYNVDAVVLSSGDVFGSSCANPVCCVLFAFFLIHGLVLFVVESLALTNSCLSLGFFSKGSNHSEGS